jgi:hypothetical protein
VEAGPLESASKHGGIAQREHSRVSCPSPAAIGPSSVTQSEDWYKKLQTEIKGKPRNQHFCDFHHILW